MCIFMWILKWVENGSLPLLPTQGTVASQQALPRPLPAPPLVGQGAPGAAWPPPDAGRLLHTHGALYKKFLKTSTDFLMD